MTNDKMINEVYADLYQFAPGDNWLGGQISVPVTVIAAGVFNENLRDREAISRSLPHWEGVPIIRYTDESGAAIHPPENIVTNVGYVVGKIRDVNWDEEGGRICGNAVFSPELGASEDFMKAVAGGARYGVSAMYFREALDESGEVEGKKYSTRSVNILPNNLAIVDRPACPKNRCGINVEEKVTLSPEHNHMIEIPISGSIPSRTYTNYDGDVTTSTVEYHINYKTENLEAKKMTEEITKEYVDGLKAAVEAEKTSRTKIEADNKTMAEKLVAETAARIAAETERDTYKKAVEEAAIAAKKTAFLGKFPEASRKAAETELLPIFMEDPSKLVLEHSERYAELLSVSVETQKKPASEGNEYVPEVAEEEKEISAMGVPSVEEMMASFGIKKKVGA